MTRTPTLKPSIESIPVINARRIVITPIYNEEDVIADVIRQIEAEADLVIAVNDGSRDRTNIILEDWLEKNNRAIVIQCRRNNGASTALRKGYALVTDLITRGIISPEDLIIEIDSDGQHNPRYIGVLCNRFESFQGQIDVVLARRDFSIYPFYKVIGNIFLTIFASLLGGFLYKDVESNFRVMKAQSFLKLLPWFSGYKYSGAFEVGIILAYLGFRIDNDYVISVPHYRAGAGFLDGFHVLWMGIRARWRLNRGARISDNETFLRETLKEVQAPAWFLSDSAPPAQERQKDNLSKK